MSWVLYLTKLIIDNELPLTLGILCHTSNRGLIIVQINNNLTTLAFLLPGVVLPNSHASYYQQQLI